MCNGSPFWQARRAMAFYTRAVWFCRAALARARFLTTLFFGVATGGETRGGRSWFRHDRPRSGRGGCLGGVARPDGEVKVVFFPSKNLATHTHTQCIDL
eukprot:COSAG06_NODE_4082_length_4593_cov_4.561638_1_plen_99_part_00